MVFESPEGDTGFRVLVIQEVILVGVVVLCSFIRGLVIEPFAKRQPEVLDLGFGLQQAGRRALHARGNGEIVGQNPAVARLDG